MGLAASYGASAKDVEYAFERGINLYYWGSFRKTGFGRGLKTIAHRDRDKVCLVIQSYARSGGTIASSLERALRKLQIDHTDILLLGWWNLPPPDRILDAARDLVERGRVRAIMVSCHHRATFPLLARDPRIDLLMVRYNAAHPGAENDVFPHLPASRPGIISYTATSWGELLDAKRVPSGERVPSALDCYRFVLSSPFVDACYTGPKNRAELDEALSALDRGEMSADELAWMKRVGASVRATASPKGSTLGALDRVINAVSGFGFRTAGDVLRDRDPHAPR